MEDKCANKSVKCDECAHHSQEYFQEYFEYPCSECEHNGGEYKMFFPAAEMNAILAQDEHPKIKDSGERRVFETGAVRDITEDKGRCDLLPLDVMKEYLERYGEWDAKNRYGANNNIYIANKKKENSDELSEAWLNHRPFSEIDEFTKDGEVQHLVMALRMFQNITEWDAYTMFLELAKHFADGAKKYSENNWKNGIPAKSYIDSAVRHLLKHLRGDKDEHHDRAFCWNIVCCIWTCKHKPELNDYTKKEQETND